MAILNKAANVTKYDAGGTGDNIIADGYIKSVEKIWIDTYTISSAQTIGVTTTLEVAVIPANKKITSIEVLGLSIIAATTSTVSIGTSLTTPAVTNATYFMAAVTFGTIASNIIKANAGIGIALTGGVNRIFLQFAGASMTVTGGTITTIVKYT